MHGSPHWYFVRDYNIATFTNISECFLPDDHPRARQCPPRPLIIDGWWYSAEVPLGGTPGEASPHMPLVPSSVQVLMTADDLADERGAYRVWKWAL